MDRQVERRYSKQSDRKSVNINFLITYNLFWNKIHSSQFLNYITDGRKNEQSKYSEDRCVITKFKQLLALPKFNRLNKFLIMPDDLRDLEGQSHAALNFVQSCVHDSRGEEVSKGWQVLSMKFHLSPFQLNKSH